MSNSVNIMQRFSRGHLARMRLRLRPLVEFFRGQGRDEARNFAPFLGRFEVMTRPSTSSDIMQGNTLTLLFPLHILLFWKKVRESLFPCMERSKLLEIMEGNTLSLTFFKKRRRIQGGKGRVSVLSLITKE